MQKEYIMLTKEKVENDPWLLEYYNEGLLIFIGINIVICSAIVGSVAAIFGLEKLLIACLIPIGMCCFIGIIYTGPFLFVMPIVVIVYGIITWIKIAKYGWYEAVTYLNNEKRGGAA